MATAMRRTPPPPPTPPAEVTLVMSQEEANLIRTILGNLSGDDRAYRVWDALSPFTKFESGTRLKDDHGDIVITKDS